MSRFYISQKIQEKTVFRRPENIVRHVKVLRLKENDAITLFNGDGFEYHGICHFENKREVFAEIQSQQAISRESSLNIVLIQAISTGERMDWTIQKSVELGVSRIIPMVTERSQHLSSERAEKRVKRWQEIIISACEQCGRNVLPTIDGVMSLPEVLQQKIGETRFLLSPRGEKQERTITPPTPITLLAGAEGGLSLQEEQQAIDAGFIPLQLGKRILRTETAALTALAYLQTRWGDF